MKIAVGLHVIMTLQMDFHEVISSTIANRVYWGNVKYAQFGIMRMF